MKDQELPKVQTRFDRIKSYIDYPRKRFITFCKKLGEKYPKLKKAYEIITHPTIIRVVALAMAVAATVLSGGTVPSALLLAFTLLGSMVAIVMKAKQFYNAEKVNQQKLIATKIGKDELDYKGLLDSLSPDDKRKFYQNSVNSKLEHQAIHHIDSPDSAGIFKGFRKTLRDKGIENIIPLIAYALGADIIGASFYAVFLLYVARKETNSRVESSKKKYETQNQINDLCERYKIKEYKNTRDLFIYYLEKKSDFQALKLTMKECKKFDENIFKKHKNDIFSNLLHIELNLFIDKKQQLDKVVDLQPPSFWRCLLFVLTPWKKSDVNLIYNAYQDATPQPSIKPKTVAKGEIKTIRIPSSVRRSFTNPRVTTKKLKQKPKTQQQIGG